MRYRDKRVLVTGGLGFIGSNLVIRLVREGARVTVVDPVIPGCGGNRYNIDPRELIRIQREGRERGEDIVGFYHSHPDHPAQWSPTDLAEAHWFGCSYVITSVEKGKAVLTNSFELIGSGEDDKKLVAEKIEVG